MSHMQYSQRLYDINSQTSDNVTLFYPQIIDPQDCFWGLHMKLLYLAAMNLYLILNLPQNFVISISWPRINIYIVKYLRGVNRCKW
jgi:hypothetical protein